MANNKSKDAPVNATTEETVTAPAAVDAAAEAERIIAEAKAEAAKIVAEAEASAKGAEKNTGTSAPVVEDMEEVVEYTAPLLPGVKKQDILVAVNSETIRIQRGVPVKIKRKFVKALEYAAKQEFASMRTNIDLQEQSKKPTASM